MSAGVLSLTLVIAALAPGGGSAASGVAKAFSYRTIATLPLGTNEAQSVVVNDKLYLFGGFDELKTTFTPTDRGWVYDPATDRWSSLPTMPTHGITHAGIATDGSNAIFYAGGSPPDASGAYQVYGTTDGWRFDIAAGTYSRLPSLPVARMGGGLSYVAGKLYYFGGNDITRTHDSSDVWMLDVAGGATSWVARAPMPDPRNHLGWGVIGGLIYAVGGQHLDLSYLAQGELDRYDPVANTWTVLAPLPIPRGHLMDSTFVMDGRLVAAGGWTASQVSAAVEAYDPASNSWQEWSDVPQARTSTTVKSVSGDRFVFCCGSAGTSNATGWIALPVAGSPTTTPPVTTTTPAVPTISPTLSPSPTGTPAPGRAPILTPIPVLTTQPPPTTPPPTTAPPTTAPPVLRPPAAAFSTVGLHPSTVGSSAAGKAQLDFRLNRSVKVSFVVQRCTNHGCTVVARRTVGSPRGPSHISILAITGHKVLADGHYRLVVTPAGGRSTTVALVVRG